MIELKRIVYFLIFLYFFILRFAIPAVRIIVNLVKLARFKKSRSTFGELIVKVVDTEKKSKFANIYNISLIVLCTAAAVLEKQPSILILNLFLFPSLLDFALFEKYSKYNGFYENGIVQGNFIKWEDIFSYKKIDSDTLSFLKKDGLRFDFGTAGKMQEVIDLISTKGIKEE